MNQRDLRELSGISTTSIAKPGKGENITTDVLLRNCTALKWDIRDIMKITSIEENAPKKQ